jgi:hypothetical protein
MNRMPQPTEDILERVRSWPEEDQQELADLARVIEARRTGVYVLSQSEEAALDEAKRGRFVPDERIAAFWKRHGMA